MMGFRWLDRYLGRYSDRVRARAEGLVRQVGGVGDGMRRESDEALQRRAGSLRERARSGEPLDSLLAETYALTREVSFRQIGMRHFDVQILGGIVLHWANIAEMKTGEGKTLAATLPVVLHALAGQGAHVITVNDYLAQRDAEWMAPVYRFLGLSVAVVTEEMGDSLEGQAKKKAAYQADITYVTNHELVFDYLRDNLADRRDEQVLRPLSFALVDEVDLLLLDEAGTPLIISGAVRGGSDLPEVARQAVSALREGRDYRVDHKMRRVSVSEAGWDTLEMALGVENLAAPEHIALQHVLHNAMLAHGVYQRDVDYVVKDGEVLLVDDHTGRVSPGKRYSDGLHQAIEAKEGVAVRGENRTLAKASYQMFFRMYPVLCGMTGTAYSAREELRRVYGLRVVVIPTNRPVVRKDYPSVVFRTAKEKHAAVTGAIAEAVSLGRPVLVGTTSVRETEELSLLLAERQIRHSVLNAKDDSAEAAIIAEAGRPSTVTVSTNMAGRGVDIVLGGSPGQPGEGAGDAAAAEGRAERQRVLDAGGLLVIGTGLHESRRIDDQLRGRAGRQGDPGASRYFLSLDDPIYRKFGERDKGTQVLQELRQSLEGHPSGAPVRDKRVRRTLEKLREKVTVENRAIRLEVLRYDVVVDYQRRTIYGWRQTILEQQAAEMIALLEEMAQDLVDDWGEAGASSQGVGGLEIPAPYLSALREMVAPEPSSSEEEEEEAESSAGAAGAILLERLRLLVEGVGADRVAEAAGDLMLAVIDERWTDHLDDLERLDDAVGLRGYGQLDPFLEFKRDAHQLYQGMLREVRAQTLGILLSIEWTE